MSIEFKLPERTSDEKVDIYASGAVELCSTCKRIVPDGYPLWGMHLQAAMALHSAHRLVVEMAQVPGLTETERRMGKRLVVDR